MASQERLYLLKMDSQLRRMSTNLLIILLLSSKQMVRQHLMEIWLSTLFKGLNLTLGEGTQAVTFVAKVTGSNLTLSFTKDEFFKLLALLGDPNDPETKAFLDLKNKITLFEYNTNYVKQ